MKQYINKRHYLPLISGIIWYFFISFVLSETHYDSMIADSIADPQGISPVSETLLAIIIVLMSFTPSGLALTYFYQSKSIEKLSIIKKLIMTIFIAIILYIPFAWYNFMVNFSR